MPASRLSSVDLPEPDGPISARKSPSDTDIDTPSSTGISIASRLYFFRTSLSSMSTATLGPFDPYGRVENDGFARHQSGLHFHLIQPFRTQNHRAHDRQTVGDDEHDFLATPVR